MTGNESEDNYNEDNEKDAKIRAAKKNNTARAGE
jgi:hypothetical protein